ncbi:uncharacterized protein LOC125312652 isoform X1 [Rhodamnia argentea]|uniref:Uncharacterized protein LOC125312652 isoform X1 n=1 Tax=Rhodamnia argentea TaxID=178133 RepID=A0ABM3GST5_9MYRT|nr:uncharacterized protein LOC125312652 isoform X1 [Rhodamnia argentea]
MAPVGTALAEAPEVLAEALEATVVVLAAEALAAEALADMAPVEATVVVLAEEAMEVRVVDPGEITAMVDREGMAPEAMVLEEAHTTVDASSPPLRGCGLVPHG